MKLLVFLIAALNIATATWLSSTQIESNSVADWEAMVSQAQDEVPRDATIPDLRGELAGLQMALTGIQGFVKKLRTYRLKSTAAATVLVIDSVAMFFALAFQYSKTATELASNVSNTDRQLNHSPHASPEE